MRKLLINFTATVAILLAGSLSGHGSKDACKMCNTSRHVTTDLNPQPLPPGVKGPGHGGNTTNYVTPGRKSYRSYKRKSAN